MAMNEVEKKIIDITKDINEWNNAYYGSGKSMVSDAVYDAVRLELEGLEQEYPQYTQPDSPTKKIGDVAEHEKRPDLQVEHRVPMLSLFTEVDTTDEPLRRFMERITKEEIDDVIIVPEYKFDGVALELQYHEGVLEHAVMRGDGMNGEDVLHHIKMARRPAPLGGSVPLKLLAPITVHIRGEILIYKEDFAEINAKIEVPFKNPRSMVAGLVRSDKSKTPHRFLRFIAYEIAWGEGRDYEAIPPNHLNALEILKKWGFTTPPVRLSYPAFKGNLKTKEAIDFHVKLIYDIYQYTLEMREVLPFEVDGMVYKINSFKQREQMGSTAIHPKWAFAHKFPAAQAQTILLDVEVSTGRTGVVTPVARLKSVLCGGVTISKANLVNEKRIIDLGLSIGDTVLVQRAGDTIPELVGVVEKVKDALPVDILTLFGSCPSCGCKTSLVGAFRMCTNTTECEAQLLGLIANAASRNLFNLTGLGDVAISRLIDSEDLTTVPDLFALTQEKLEYAGLSVSEAQKVMDQVKKALEAPAYVALAALGIPRLGKSTAKNLLDRFQTIKGVLDASEAEIATVHRIGADSAKALRKHLDAMRETINQLLSLEATW